MAKRVGSLERGKDATLFLTTGDPLETPTQVTAVWIRGRKVDLFQPTRPALRKVS